MSQKLGGGGCALFLGVAGSLLNTNSPGLRPTTIPSGILVHPAVWPQRTLAENWGVVHLWRRGSWVRVQYSVAYAEAYLHTK